MNQSRQLLVIPDEGYIISQNVNAAQLKKNASIVFFFSVDDLIKTTALKGLWEVIQLLLTLSHGQAAVERGFSVNSSLVQPNLKSHSLVAQRMIYDTVIRTEQPIANFQVTQEGGCWGCIPSHQPFSNMLLMNTIFFHNFKPFR